MDILLWALVAGFATYRLSLAITAEEGPFGLFLGFRNLFVNENWLGRGVRCIHCVSFWVGLPFAFLVPAAVYGLLWAQVLLLWLALSGFTVVINRYWAR